MLHNIQFLAGTNFIPFTITVDTTKAGSASDTFILPLNSTATYDFEVAWGDGNKDTITVWNQAETTHQYSVSGVYQIKISGVFDRIYFNNAGDKLKLSSIDKWGDVEFKNMASAFFGCANMTGTYSDIPNVSAVTDMFAMFTFCALFNSSVLGWDVSAVMKMQSTFQGCTVFNQPIDWDTVSVTNFLGFLSAAPAFDQDLSAFDISSVTNLGLFLNGGGVSTANYDLLLVGWEAQVEKLNVSFDAGSSTFTLLSAADTARGVLIATSNWTITDGGGI